MAYTFTAAASTVFGNQRIIQGVLTADATSGVVSFGLGTITHVQWSPKSMSTTGVRVRMNASAANVASVGDLGVSGAVNGDELFVMIHGR
tara:strand:- start:883 stop:1152 length:270 start_codon:yes stop_codon:yes gene_type:complete